MYAERIHTTLVDRHLVIDLLPEAPLGKAEILVLIEPEKVVGAEIDEGQQQAGMSVQEFSAWLKTQPHTQRTPEDFARQIEEERNAWGDD